MGPTRGLMAWTHRFLSLLLITFKPSHAFLTRWSSGDYRCERLRLAQVRPEQHDPLSYTV
jgi:hypothetical protein